MHQQGAKHDLEVGCYHAKNGIRLASNTEDPKSPTLCLALDPGCPLGHDIDFNCVLDGYTAEQAASAKHLGVGTVQAYQGSHST